MEGPGGDGKPLVCRSKWTVERLRYASDIRIAVSIDRNSLALFTARAPQKCGINKRYTIRRKLRDEGIKTSSRSIKSAGRDGKVGRVGVAGYICAAGTINGNCFAPIFSAIDDLSTTKVRRINQKRTAAIYLCHKRIIVSAGEVRLESIDGWKRADRGTTHGPSSDVCIATHIERNASTKVVKVAAEPS